MKTPIPLCALLSLSAFAAEPNVMKITAGGPGKRANYVFVTVRICEPGTNNCRDIPDVQLDSGSTGLRIFASALPLQLPPSKDKQAREIGECKIFGGGDVLWGSVARADVILGAEKAANVSVQIVDTKFAAVPADCEHPREQIDQWTHGNGILGTGPALSDCGGAACDPKHYQGARYYGCGPQGCTELPMALSGQVQNPIASLPVHNNGSIVRLPSVPATAAEDASYIGELVLGIGTAPNNQPPKNLAVFGAEGMGWVPVSVAGKKSWAKIDTGADYYSLPEGASGLPHCKGSLGLYLCPEAPGAFPLTVESYSDTNKLELSLPVRNAEQMFAQNKNRFLIPDVAYEFGGKIGDVVIIGLPFFFGRDVYLGIDGKKSSVGNGPFYAF